MLTNFTPKELKLIEQCNIAQLEYQYDCETCPNADSCTDFMLNHSCVPIQAISALLKDNYTSDTEF